MVIGMHMAAIGAELEVEKQNVQMRRIVKKSSTNHCIQNGILCTQKRRIRACAVEGDGIQRIANK